MNTFLLLIALHFICDYVFQSEYIAINKNSKNVGWIYVMTAHCATHALAVTYVLGPTYGIVEFFLHFLIDHMKCKNKYGIHIDQGLHVLCKIIYGIMSRL